MFIVTEYAALTAEYIIKCLMMFNRIHIVIEVVSRLFAGDNRLSPDILLVTTGCHQTFCW